jgi:serine/threonine protein kinase
MSLDENVLANGSKIGKYTIRRLMGAGGMGAVYEADHDELRRRVAVKVLLRRVAEIPEARARFLREGQIAARIHHTNVVEIFDVGVHEGAPFIVMEFLEGESLAAYVAREGAVTVEVAVDLILPVIAALDLAHTEGVLHRDIKPENIFLARTRQGALQPKLLDFGISRIVGDQGGNLTADASILGTPHYLSPEQAFGRKDLDARSDVYSVGVVFYQLVSGRHPVEATELLPLLHAIAGGDLVPLERVRPDLPASLHALVRRCLATQRDDRFVCMRSLGGALLPFASPRSRVLWSELFDPNGVSSPAVRDHASVRMSGESGVDNARASSGEQVLVTPMTRQISVTATDLEDDFKLPTRRWGLWAGAGMSLVSVAAVSAWLMMGDGRTEATAGQNGAAEPASELRAGERPTMLRLAAEPATAVISIDGREVGRGDAELTIDSAQPHTLRVEAPGHVSVERQVPPGGGWPMVVRLDPEPPVGHDGPTHAEQAPSDGQAADPVTAPAASTPAPDREPDTARRHGRRSARDTALPSSPEPTSPSPTREPQSPTRPAAEPATTVSPSTSTPAVRGTPIID